MSENKRDTARRDAGRTEMASAINLFVHPVAGAAAWSAFGFGLMSQAFGFWMGAMNGAGSAAQRLLDPAAPSAPKTNDRAGDNVVVLARRPARPATVPDRPAPADIRPEPAVPTASAEAMQMAADDLKAISGIGPKLEKVLNGLGVRSYGQIASWSGEEIAAIEGKLGFPGRIVRDDWMGQAAALTRAVTKK